MSKNNVSDSMDTEEREHLSPYEAPRLLCLEMSKTSTGMSGPGEDAMFTFLS